MTEKQFSFPHPKSIVNEYTQYFKVVYFGYISVDDAQSILDASTKFVVIRFSL